MYHFNLHQWLLVRIMETLLSDRFYPGGISNMRRIFVLESTCPYPTVVRADCLTNKNDSLSHVIILSTY